VYLKNDTMAPGKKSAKLAGMIQAKTIAAALLLVLPALSQPAPGIRVTGADGKTSTIAMADLSALPQQSVKATDHGTPVSFEGVLLSDVLSRVELPTGEKLRGKALAMYAVVEASDGYRVLFALPELDPAFSDKRVYLVTKRDGKPLSEKEGPFRIVVPDEKRPARWVRQVTAIKIKMAE
jgi:hypothetical protein